MPQRADYAALPSTWRNDLLAGLTVGIVALPLALGFGISSGAGAEAGIITAVIAGIIAAVFGGSHIQVSGPTGAMVVVLAPIMSTHGLQALALVTVMAGVLVLIAGALKLGRIVSFIPWPVIEGFTVGIGIIIFLQQIPSLTSHSYTPSSNNAAVAAFQALTHAEASYLLWALGAVGIVAACMILLPKVHAAIPGSLVGIVVVTIMSLVLPSGLASIGALPNTVHAPHLPAFSSTALTTLLPAALTIAALAAIESLLSARVASSMSDTGPYDPDRELVGQGLASIGSGLFGGMPATGAIARTAVNVKAGARTRVAAIFHSLVLITIIGVAAQPVGLVPLASLAGVLMVTAIRMIDLTTARSILTSTRSDAVAFTITALVTVSVDLIVAVVIGIGVAGFLILRRLSRSTSVTVETIAHSPESSAQAIATIKIDGPLFFAAADRVLHSALAVEGVSVAILRVSRLGIVDATGAHVLSEIVRQLSARNITVLIKGVQPSHLELFRRVGVLESLQDQGHIFQDLELAVEYAKLHLSRT